ncbi:MAG: hypothetical protein ABGZ35_05035, partial [Planctomycetaceae bacterium]
RGRHYIAFQISNTGVMKLGRQKHGKQLFMQSFFCPCWGTWANAADRESTMIRLPGQVFELQVG